MTKTIVPVFSLLLSTALLIIGHGLLLTLLPIRGEINGFNTSEIGLTASFYFIGFIFGCAWYYCILNFNKNSLLCIRSLASSCLLSTLCALGWKIMKYVSLRHRLHVRKKKGCLSFKERCAPINWAAISANLSQYSNSIFDREAGFPKVVLPVCSW